MEDLISRHRPKTLDEVWGNDDIKRKWRARLARRDPPHSIILVGDSGLGKTTLARIFCDEIIHCLGLTKKSFVGNPYEEYDGSSEERYNALIKFITAGRSMLNPVKICYVDEAHHMTLKQQIPFLKLIEDRPDLYLIFSTTNIEKIIEPLKKRRSPIYTLFRPSMSESKVGVGGVAQKEELVFLPDALECLITLSGFIPGDCVGNLGEFFGYEEPITKEMVRNALLSKVGSGHMPKP